MERTIVESASVGFVLSSILIGLAFGFILQRGRYCTNTAFRDVIFINDFTLFRAFTIALITMIVGANLLNDLGFLKLASQNFLPLANIIGGYIFGLGIVLAGGCGSGVWYKVGEGQLGAGVAVLGFLTSASATTHGILNPLYKTLMSVRMPVAGKSNATLWQIFGDGMTEKWLVIGALAVASAVFVIKGKPFTLGKQRGFYWSLTGLLIGITGIAAFWASFRWGGGSFARGLNFTTPTSEIMNFIVTGNPKSLYFPSYSIGGFKVTWALLNVLAVPIGAYISAKILKEHLWKVPPARELITVFFGGLLMGFGGILGGGCTVGQALTGVTTLSVGSLVATIFMILGNWTMVYFKFIKPMEE